MKTLIELYDERPIENILASEVFRPERTVFLCPPEIAEDRDAKETLVRYFHHRGLNTELIFWESSMYYSDKVAKQLKKAIQTYPDCVVEITGGTDAALFACGMVCAELNVPVFTYSRKRNCFFGIHGTPFPEPLNCTVQHKGEDCFLMAGGAMRTGRVDNSRLGKYMQFFDPFFALYLRHRSEWARAITYIQCASQQDKFSSPVLQVSASYTVKGERGNWINAPEEILHELADMGFIRDLQLDREGVRFTFRDTQVRTWLRDIGSVLELYVYKVCQQSGLFHDVVSSAVVDWKGDFRRDSVTNEIDVMAMKGVLPVFISCKTCAISTEALNELAILRDRFGGNGARAAIITTQRCRTVTRHRAAALDIDVIDLDDLKAGRIEKQIAELLRED